MADRLVRHSNDILSYTAKTQFIAAQNGMLARRYLLTGEKVAIQKFMFTQKALASELRQFRVLTAKDRNILKPLDSLNSYINKRILFSARMIKIKQARGFDAALAFLRNGKGESFVDEADTYVNIISMLERRTLEDRKSKLATAQLQRNLALAITLLFILIIIVVLIYNAMRESLLRKKMIADLIKKDERYKKAEQLAVLGTWTLDLESGLVSGSDEMFKIWELPASVTAIQYDQFMEHIHPEDQERIRYKVSMLKDQSDIDNYEFRLLINGLVKYISTAVTVIRREDGMPGYVSGYVQDITEKKMAELERERMLLALRHRNAALEEFNYMVSHNLRRPVANLIALCALLGTEMPADETAYIVSKIQTSAGNLDEIVKGLNTALQVKRNRETK